eukprot:608249-Amphidinium_carterae.1
MRLTPDITRCKKLDICSKQVGEAELWLLTGMGTNYLLELFCKLLSGRLCWPQFSCLLTNQKCRALLSQLKAVLGREAEA